MSATNFPWTAFLVSAGFFLGIPLFYIFVILPVAETTDTPDLIELEAFFGGLMMMALAFVTMCVSVAYWIQRRN
jgi:hypothetical protein